MLFKTDFFFFITLTHHLTHFLFKSYKANSCSLASLQAKSLSNTWSWRENLFCVIHSSRIRKDLKDQPERLFTISSTHPTSFLEKTTNQPTQTNPKLLNLVHSLTAFPGKFVALWEHAFLSLIARNPTLESLSWSSNNTWPLHQHPCLVLTYEWPAFAHLALF